MSSRDLENGDRALRRPGQRILTALKLHGRLSAAAIASMLGITAEAVRQQLARLSREELVTAETRAEGVGRPARLWRLTDRAQQCFPDMHAALTVQLIDIVRSELGEAAFHTVIAARAVRTAGEYRIATADAVDLDERVAALAGLRTREGYMADSERRPDGALVLVENHCPVRAAASACQSLCQAELEVFRAVLGPEVSVERSEHMLAKDRRCAYVVTRRHPHQRAR